MNKILTTAAFSSIAASLVLAGSAMAAEVVSLNSSDPTSDEIIQGFTGNKAGSEEGGIPGVKFRGIRMKKAPEASSSCDVPSGAVALHIQFEVNSFNLSPNGRKTLDEMAKAMQSAELRNCNFMIEGHTDASGKASYNQWLSEKRAQSVGDYLTGNSVASARLEMVGKGENEPLNPRNTYAAENRRVQFAIVNGQ